MAAPAVNSPGAGQAVSVSVIISTYNRAGTLARALDSVLAQDFSALEVIVINDGSTDATGQVLSAYRAEPRVRVLNNDHNLGLPAALNRGIELARGEFMARLDDDDYWSEPGKLSLQVAFLRQHPDIGLVGSAYRDEWGRAIVNPLTDADIRRQMLFRCPFCHSSVLARLAVLRQAGGYDEQLPYAEDWALWLRIGTLSRLANLSAPCVVKEPGADNLSERFFMAQLDMAGEFCRQYSEAYPGAGRARFHHAVSKIFFRLFPVDGAVHRFMRKVFIARFDLHGAGRANDGPAP